MLVLGWLRINVGTTSLTGEFDRVSAALTVIKKRPADGGVSLGGALSVATRT